MIVINENGGPLGGPTRFLDKAAGAMDSYADFGLQKKQSDRADKALKADEEERAKVHNERAQQRGDTLSQQNIENRRADEGLAIHKQASDVANEWTKHREEQDRLERADQIHENRASLAFLLGRDPTDQELGVTEEDSDGRYDVHSDIPPSIQVQMRKEMESPSGAKNPQSIAIAAKQAVRERQVSGLRATIQRIAAPDPNQEGAQKGAGGEADMRREQTLPADRAKRFNQLLDHEAKRPGSVDLEGIKTELHDYVRQANRARADNDAVQIVGEEMQTMIDAARKGGASIDNTNAAQVFMDGMLAVPPTGAGLEAAKTEFKKVLNGTSTASKTGGKQRPKWMTDQDEQYDRDLKNAKDLGKTGDDAEAWILKQQQTRAARGGQPAGQGQGQPSPAPPPETQAPDPETRVKAVSAWISQWVDAGKQVPPEVEFAAMKAARDGKDIEGAMRKALKDLQAGEAKKAKPPEHARKGNPKAAQTEMAYPRKTKVNPKTGVPEFQ